jgi:hypothetical protein
VDFPRSRCKVLGGKTRCNWEFRRQKHLSKLIRLIHSVRNEKKRFINVFMPNFDSIIVGPE